MIGSQLREHHERPVDLVPGLVHAARLMATAVADNAQRMTVVLVAELTFGLHAVVGDGLVRVDEAEVNVGGVDGAAASGGSAALRVGLAAEDKNEATEGSEVKNQL